MIPYYQIIMISLLAVSCVGLVTWFSADFRIIRGVSRIRRKDVAFAQCSLVDVERYLEVVTSIRLTMNDGAVLKFIPDGKINALCLAGITNLTSIQIARDPNGGPAAIIRAVDTEASGAVYPYH